MTATAKQAQRVCPECGQYLHEGHRKDCNWIDAPDLAGRQAVLAKRTRVPSLVDCYRDFERLQSLNSELVTALRSSEQALSGLLLSMEFDERVRGQDAERSTVDFPKAIAITKLAREQARAALKRAEG